MIFSETEARRREAGTSSEWREVPSTCWAVCWRRLLGRFASRENLAGVSGLLPTTRLEPSDQVPLRRGEVGTFDEAVKRHRSGVLRQEAAEAAEAERIRAAEQKATDWIRDFLSALPSKANPLPLVTFDKVRAGRAAGLLRVGFGSVDVYSWPGETVFPLNDWSSTYGSWGLSPEGRLFGIATFKNESGEPERLIGSQRAAPRNPRHVRGLPVGRTVAHGGSGGLHFGWSASHSLRGDPEVVIRYWSSGNRDVGEGWTNGPPLLKLLAAASERYRTGRPPGIS